MSYKSRQKAQAEDADDEADGGDGKAAGDPWLTTTRMATAMVLMILYAVCLMKTLAVVFDTGVAAYTTTHMLDEQHTEWRAFLDMPLCRYYYGTLTEHEQRAYAASLRKIPRAECSERQALLTVPYWLAWWGLFVENWLRVQKTSSLGLLAVVGFSVFWLPGLVRRSVRCVYCLLNPFVAPMLPV